MGSTAEAWGNCSADRKGTTSASTTWRWHGGRASSIAPRVAPEVDSEVIPTPMASIHLTLKQPQADGVTSEQQVQEYGRIFRRTKDEIHARLPQPVSESERCGASN